MDKINWDKKVALEIVQAGFIRMTKKYHPDVGGTQEQILVLSATKDQLEKLISGGRPESTFDYQRAREEPRRRHTYRNTRSQYWDQADQSKKTDESTGEVPIEPYEDDSDYVQIREVTVMSFTEKAVRIKIPTVKQGQWLPKSQMLCDDFSGWAEGDVITVVFSKWIARQKGWIK